MTEILVAIAALWLPLAVLTAYAGALALVAVFVDWGYAKDLLRGMDKLGAIALKLGRGDFTISAECGKRLQDEKACRFCRWVCAVYDLIEPGHCRGAAENEGLIQKH